MKRWIGTVSWMNGKYWKDSPQVEVKASNHATAVYRAAAYVLEHHIPPRTRIESIKVSLHSIGAIERVTPSISTAANVREV